MMKKNNTRTEFSRILAITALVTAIPLVVFAETWAGFTTSRMSTPGISGIYWQTSTSQYTGDLEVDAAVVDNNGNVSEVATFDQEGTLIHGSNTDASESLGDYIARTEGGTDTGGFYDPNDPYGNPYNCDFDCGSDPFADVNNSFGSGF